MTPTEIQSIWDEEFKRDGPRENMNGLEYAFHLTELVRRVTIRTLATPCGPKQLPKRTRCGCADAPHVYMSEQGFITCTVCRLPVDKHETKGRTQVPTPPEHVAGRLLGLPADLEDALRLLVRHHTITRAEGFALGNIHDHSRSQLMDAWATVRRRLGLPS